LAVGGPAEGAERELRPCVGTFALSADGQSVYLTAEDLGLEKLYVVPTGGGNTLLAVTPTRGVYTNLAIAPDASTTVIVANWGSAIEPTEIVRIDPATREHRLLTSFTTERAARLAWRPPQHFTFTSSRKKTIHNMIVLPGGFDPTRKYPLLVLIHGGAANMWRDHITLRWNYHLLAQPGYVVLLTNYTGSSGFGEKFARDIRLDPFSGPASEINEAADEAIRRYAFIDGTRQIAAGASYGGHLINWLEATTTRYRALAGHAGLVNSEVQWGTSDVSYERELMNGGPPWLQAKTWTEQNPIRKAANFKTPILLSVGERDFRVPMNNTLENWSALQRMKVPSRLLVWPDENHWITNGENSRPLLPRGAGVVYTLGGEPRERQPAEPVRRSRTSGPCGRDADTDLPILGEVKEQFAS
jgi:dipeptidyl aminopeptidase/acylaminoacyl peptidase